MDSIAQLLASVFVSAWSVTARMAPYLLFGFAVAGVLHVLLPSAWVARFLGGRGFAPSVKAALFGVPLPLCSCSVIPVAASLRRQGAGRGATAAFLMSTPQTGVDSILVTYGLLGPVFAVVRPVVAFVSGALCGIAVDRLSSGGELPSPIPTTAPARVASGWRRAVKHGFGTLPSDIGRELVLGLAVAGLIGALVPANFLADKIPPGLPGMALMMLVGIPMYVCSTASVPIALGLVQAGVSPGAALVFLITGPATNAATLGTLGRLLGPRAGGIYLACLVATALAAGVITDFWLMPAFPQAAPVCHPDSVSVGEHISAVALFVLLAGGWIQSARRRSVRSSTPKCCCAGNAGKP